jgi:small subunit ribosomal protein S8
VNWPISGSFPAWSSQAGKEGRKMSVIVSDPVGDMLARIRNAQERGKNKVVVPPSRLRERVLEVLHKEGYIRGFTTVEKDGKSELEVELKYFDGAPVIKEVHRVSKPGRRVYASVTTLPSVYNGLGIAILSTPKGVMTDADARAQNVGGEVLCTVF